MRHIETPSRLLRRADEAAAQEVPSLPDIPLFDESNMFDSGSFAPSFDKPSSILERKSYGRSHSTPPPLARAESPPGSLYAQSSKSNTSAERFAASLHTSKASTAAGSRGALDASFEVPSIRHERDELASMSRLLEESHDLDAPSFGLLVPSEDEDDGEHPLESISLSLSSKSHELQGSISTEPKFESANVTRRRPMPRLRDDFINAAQSLSSTSLTSTPKLTSPSTYSSNPSPQEKSFTQNDPTANVVGTPSPIQRASPPKQPTRIPPAPNFLASVTAFGASQGLGSIREESRSYEQEDMPTPMPQRFMRRSRSPPSETEDEARDQNFETNAGFRSIGGTPSISPPSQLLQQRNQVHIPYVERSPSGTNSATSLDITESYSNHNNASHLSEGAFLTPRPAPQPPQNSHLPTATPADRHKSFLLSLAHGSNVRPRYAAPTPHPRFRMTPGPGGSLPRIRPKARLSHPLSQGHTPESLANSPSHPDASFISTTSSHDLIINERANASFDPTTDAGAKFNQVKLNGYLRGLNKHLIEENEALVMQLTELRGTQGEGNLNASPTSTDNGGGKRIMHDLVAALQDELASSKASHETLQIEHSEFRESHASCADDIAQLRQALDDVQAENKRRTDTHVKKVQQLTEGADIIVRETQAQLEDAQAEIEILRSRRGDQESERVRRAEEASDLERAARLEAEREYREILADHGPLKSSIAHLEGQINDLRSELDCERNSTKDVKAKLREEQDLLITVRQQLTSENHRATSRIASLEGQLINAEERVALEKARAEQTEHALQQAEDTVERDAEERRVVSRKMDTLVRERDQAQSEAAQAKLLVTSRKFSGSSTALSEFTPVSPSISSTSAAGATTGVSREEHDRLVGDLEEQLDDAQREIGRLQLAVSDTSSAQAIAKAKSLKIEALERENSELHEKVSALRLAIQPFASPGVNTTPIRGSALGQDSTPQARRALFNKTMRTPGDMLADFTMFQNTPGNISVDVAQYLARVDALRSELLAADHNYDAAMDELGAAGLTNVKLVELLHDARTKVTDLHGEIARLKKADEHMQKLHQRLQRCRCPGCGKRFHALQAISQASDTSAILGDSVSSIDISIIQPARSRAALEASLEKLNEELAGLKTQWASEKDHLTGEKAILRDTANRLKAEVKAENAKLDKERKHAKEVARGIEDDAGRQRALLQIDLDRARSSINTLEAHLEEERRKSRDLSAQQSRAARETNEILSKLSRSEREMEEVRADLGRARQQNEELEAELRESSQADDKAKHLTAKLSDNQNLLDQLKHERETLLNNQTDLRRRYALVTEKADSIRQQQVTSQAEHEKRRLQLSTHASEVENLRQALQEQAAELRSAKEARLQLANNNAEVASTLSALQAELERVRLEARQIAKDVIRLKEERKELHAHAADELLVSKRSQIQIRKLHEELVSLKRMNRRLTEGAASHVCVVDDHGLHDMRLNYKEQFQGLLLRIRYLKARITRESSFRHDLAYQKEHLLITIERFEKTEHHLTVTMSRLGFPKSFSPPRKKRSLRSVAFAVVFLRRVQSAAAVWQVAQNQKESILSAYEDVRGHPLVAM